MANNLKSRKLNDTTIIPRVTGDTQWNVLTTPAFCWYNNDSATYADTYGALYNWYTVESDKLCPAGWHIPDMDDVVSLFASLGGQKVDGGKLKVGGTAHWLEPNVGGTNESGFTGVPGGIRENGIFDLVGLAAFYHTDTVIFSNEFVTLFPLVLAYNNSGAYPTGANSKKHGFSARCLKA